jgi:histidyl-tRNA synthetase
MIKTPRGTKDILPSESFKWHFLEEKFKQVTNLFSYRELRTPIFEVTEVFSRSIGEETDIVNKEMYTFSDRSDTSLTLRPEMTAALVRSAIENSLTNTGGVQRLWYFGPFFRYERPQKGRFRQFHQFGIECLSSDRPESDVEVLHLADTLIKEIGINDYTLFINSIGNKASREIYNKVLVEFLQDNKQKLSETSQDRLEKNPLRILDSKADSDIELLISAPKISEHLDQESQEHYSEVKEKLDYLGINYKENNKLVRGLDYYSHTVFEFQSNLLGAQDSFGGGGRYNELFSQLGGKDVPSVGFAMGVERLLLILDGSGKFIQEKEQIDLYIVKATTNDKVIYELIRELRSKNVILSYDLLARSVKSQFKEADKIGAKWTIVIGDNEIENNKVMLKNMSNSLQQEISLDKISEFNFKN